MWIIAYEKDNQDFYKGEMEFIMKNNKLATFEKKNDAKKCADELLNEGIGQWYLMKVEVWGEM